MISYDKISRMGTELSGIFQGSVKFGSVVFDIFTDGLGEGGKLNCD